MQNFHHLRLQVEALCASAKVDLIVLPETFSGVPAEDGDDAPAAQARQFLSTLARVCEVAVVGGSITHRSDDGNIHNTSYVMDRTGACVGTYDKRRLFAHELETRTPGTEAGVFEVDGMRIGVLICADLWYPELARTLIGRVDILCVPSATVVQSEANRTYARGVWHQLALVRAVENGLVVAVSDWADGRHEAKRVVNDVETREVAWTAGVASVSDPSHRPDLQRLQRTSHRGEECHVLATIDLARLEAYRDYRRSVGLLPSGDQ